MNTAVRVLLNYGAGNPVAGWENLDASPLYLLGKIAHRFLSELHLSDRSKYFLSASYEYNTFRSGSTLPYHDSSVDIVYCCHVMEHLYPVDARSLLDEFQRIVKRGGIVRILVPDIEREITSALESSGPILDLNAIIGLFPQILVDKPIRAAIEGLSGFPSVHKTMFRKSLLPDLIDGRKWELKVCSGYLDSKIEPKTLASIENRSRCENALIFELTKN